MTGSSSGSNASASGAILRLLDRPVSNSDLDAGTIWASRPAEAHGTTKTGLLLFRITDETAAVSAKLLRRVTPVARARPIPHVTAGIFRGLCNIRGELVLCADLRALLGLPGKDHASASPDGASDPRRMVVIGPAENSWAFEVDALIGIERLDMADLRPPPVTVEYAMSAFTMGLIDIDGRRVTMLDGERIIAAFKAGIS
jgi:chemotaxis signal transduction protein